jgi:aryl-alcohol dehydrogenase-like predicted oxidoreductase
MQPVFGRNVVRTRTIGTEQVSAIGLGEMQLSLADRPDEAQGVRTIHAALDAGVTLIDTADAYCADGSEMGHGERLTAKALSSYRDTAHVLVATKGGHTRDARGGWGTDGSPAYLRKACDASLTALGVDVIDLYQHHRPDPTVPYEETLGALKELHDAGKVRMLGLSNADVDQIRQGVEICGDALVSVQNQYAPNFRSSEPELELCTELGLAFLPWGPLGGAGRASRSAGNAVTEVADAHGVSPQQVALAWMLAKSPAVVPIPGSSRPETIADSAAAADLELTPDELAKLR